MIYDKLIVLRNCVTIECPYHISEIQTLLCFATLENYSTSGSKPDGERECRMYAQKMNTPHTFTDISKHNDFGRENS